MPERVIGTGKCTCGEVEYELREAPMFVHCCHCTWCQRETGSAFAINALIESDKVVVVKGAAQSISIPSNSGIGQNISRCPSCKTALWSNYGAAKEAVSFLRVGTLNSPDAFPPDIHIFTSTKQKWVQLDSTIPVVAEYYQRSKYWPESSVVRYKHALQA
ncbi:MAG: GFA family protein [Halioglobus sp.]